MTTKPPSARLDVWLGEENRRFIEREAALTGKSPGEIVREAYITYRLGAVSTMAIVREAVLAAAQAVEPTGAYDPAESNPAEDAALKQLAAALGSFYAAMGVMDALREVQTRGDAR